MIEISHKVDFTVRVSQFIVHHSTVLEKEGLFHGQRTIDNAFHEMELIILINVEFEELPVQLHRVTTPRDSSSERWPSRHCVAKVVGLNCKAMVITIETES
jgi:hypothetical protein